MGFYAAFLLTLYILFDVNYFLQYIVLMTTGFLRWRHLKRPLLEPDVTTGRCSLSDLDHMMHMNNAKYLRAFEFGRAAFGLKNRLWHKAKKLKAHLLISAQVVRYRRPVTVFQAFEIRSKCCFTGQTSVLLSTMHGKLTLCTGKVETSTLSRSWSRSKTILFVQHVW
ncbi:hypothetical protein V5799_010610 [Amblyomma americanum]|uniref:Protein THEM6 n=1 Tax=Amblyomma americanum TaxID=6943 RepID=A0AAQ4EJE7_AMBAM